ncbi:hypothetical protein [Streptomyces sp. NPDC017991]|uniref:hypothetical protein n=1 Tax=Streptomyces sp. NPDC017991 TaxID=3365026 RepID=UPI0037A24B9F
MTAHGRLTAGERQLFDTSVALPTEYKAAIDAILNLFPATLSDAANARDWLDLSSPADGP